MCCPGPFWTMGSSPNGMILVSCGCLFSVVQDKTFACYVTKVCWDKPHSWGLKKCPAGLKKKNRSWRKCFVVRDLNHWSAQLSSTNSDDDPTKLVFKKEKSAKLKQVLSPFFGEMTCLPAPFQFLARKEQSRAFLFPSESCATIITSKMLIWIMSKKRK